jgi:hypothetical protein
VVSGPQAISAGAGRSAGELQLGSEVRLPSLFPAVQYPVEGYGGADFTPPTGVAKSSAQLAEFGGLADELSYRKIERKAGTWAFPMARPWLKESRISSAVASGGAPRVCDAAGLEILAGDAGACINLVLRHTTNRAELSDGNAMVEPGF